MSSGLILGFITGLTYGMLGVGIVLVYKSSRFVNLAHGSLGALSAVILATLVLDAGWSWWLAFPVVVAVGVGLGLGVERSFVRPLRHRNRRGITLLLVTIGISQLLLALTFVPVFAPDPTTLLREQYPLPFTMHWRILDTDITGSHLMILLLVPATVGALAVFLRSTMLGKSIRGAASNADAARLCGVSVDRVNAITWGIAGALNAVTAVLLAPGQSVFDAGALGPGLLFRALGAAALGAFVSIPAAMVGGVGLGVIEGLALSSSSRGTTAELAVFIAVMAVLFLRGRAISAVADSEENAEDHSTRPVPPAVADHFVVRHHRTLLGSAGLLIAIALPLFPYLGRTENRFLLTIVLVFAIVGVGLTMLLGWAGQVSLGHFALVGVGAFGASRLSERDLSLPLVVVLVGLLGAAIMTVVGLPALRLRGLTLAVTTLGFAVVAPAWLFTQPWFGVERGTAATIEGLGVTGVGRLQSDLSIYYTALGLLAATALMAGLLRRSIPGRLIVAARDNERALAMFGVTPATVKLATLAVSGFIAASAGVIWGTAWRNVSPDLVSPSQSFALLVIPVVGGLGSVSGAVAGTFAIFVPTYFIGPELSGFLGDFGRNLGFQLALSGAGLTLIPLAYPAGVAGLGRRWWDGYLARLAGRAGNGGLGATAVPAADQSTSVSVDDLAPILGRAATRATGCGDDHASASRRSPGDSIHGDPLIVDGVSLSFGGIHALSEVSLRVRPGEIVGLIGTNGAGKTTLIDVISGLHEPDAGRVTVAGVDVTDLAPEIRAGYGLGRSFQDARLFPGLSAIGAVQVALANAYKVGVVSSLAGAPWAREANERSRREASALLHRTGLGQWETSLTSELSTGMRRITDLTMQIAARPQLLLLDEPAGGVAQREAEALGPMLRSLRDELDCGMLIVEHDMPLLMGLCDRIYAMKAGRIIAEGTPQEVRDNPAVVASYLGTDASAIERSGRKAIAPTRVGDSSAAGGNGAQPGRGRREPLVARETTAIPNDVSSSKSHVDPTIASAPPILEARDVDFGYGRLQVLFGLSMRVARGESLALLGTNGAGKSTLLRVLSGLETPSRGTVNLDGADVTGQPAESLVTRGLVLIPGGKAVFPDMTVEENLELQALTERHDVERVKQRRQQVLELLPALGTRLNQPAGRLSGGEQQQLALAKAIMLEPSVLCIDELSLGLAPVVVQELLEVVRTINDAGVTIVLVEQSLNIAAQLCTRAIFLEKGEVRFEGRPTELLERDDIARAVFLGGQKAGR